jgi:hypothetical protein
MNRFTTSLWTFLLLGLATPLLPADETPATSPADAPNTPRRACRLMVNWDQSNMSGLQLTAAHRQNAPTAASVQTAMERIVDDQAHAGIDRIVQCVFALPRGVVPAGFRSFPRDQIAERLFEDTPVGFAVLEEAGIDRIQLALDRAHLRGLEFLGGLRMNDRHEKSNAWHASHPDWQLPEFPGGMDYRHAGVRDTVLQFVDEFLERYDVDGLELDWQRWCHVFRPAEAESNAPLLTDFVRQVRRRLDAAATRRGRARLLLGVRVPQSLTECRGLGYDVAAWIQTGALDFVCPSDFFYTDFSTRVEEFVALARGTGVRIYPALHPMIGWGNDHQNLKLANYRAAAKSAFEFGADGLQLYNFHYHWRADKGRESDWPEVLYQMAQVRDLALINPHERIYLFHPMWSGHREGVGPSGVHRDIRLILPPGDLTPRPLDLRLAEDPAESRLRIVLKLKATGLAPRDNLRVLFNGAELPVEPDHRRWVPEGQGAREGRVLPPHDLFQIPLQAHQLRRGDNRLSVARIETTGTSEVVVQEFEVHVTPPAP